MRPQLGEHGHFGLCHTPHINNEEGPIRMHEQGCTQTDMEHFDRMALARKSFVALKRGVATETTAQSRNPIVEEAGTP